MAVVEINKGNFEQEVTKSRGTVLLDFWADWCGPCKMQGPILEELAKKKPELKIGKINVTNEDELAGRFDITSIPTLAVVRDGEIVKMEAGLKTETELFKWLE